MLMALPFYSPVVDYRLAIFCLICVENVNAWVKAKLPKPSHLLLNGLDSYCHKFPDVFAFKMYYHMNTTNAYIITVK